VTAPAPRKVKARTDDIVKLVMLIDNDYDWLHDAAHMFGTRDHRTDVGSRQHHSVHSDLSGLMTGDISYIRGKVASAAEHYEKAFKELVKAEADLKDAFVRIDARHPGETDRFEKVIEKPDEGELKKLKAAQARREADPQRRGECR
jgi:hypothetical protein